MRHERKDLGPRHGRRWLTAIAIGALALSPVVVGADQSPALAATDWSQVGGLGLGDIDGEAASDSSGYSVSLSGDGTRVAIGAIDNDGTGTDAGHVRVYSWNGTTWSQLGADIDGEAASDSSGWSVSLSDDGTRVAIGAPNNDGSFSNAGHVRVYELRSGAWVQLGADIDGEAASDYSGYSVSLSDDGTRVAIGARSNDGSFSNAGHVRVYSWSGTAWSQLGADIDGEAASDFSGYSVSLSDDGTRVAIGALENDGSFSNAGHVRVYSWSGTAWSQLGADIDGEAASDFSGYSVSLSDDGTRVAIGARNNDGSFSNAGHVRVYSWNGTTWSQLGADIDGEAASDSSGESVSLSDDGTRVAIGAPNNDGGGSNAGHVRVYSWNGTTWSQLGADIDGEAAADFSGYSVSLSDDGTRVAIGAFENDGSFSNAGHVRVFSTPVSVSVSSATSAGTPGIFLHITGPVGRSVAGSPVYYGADRVQVTSNYTLTLTPVGGNRPPVTMLAEGTIELNGSFATSVRLDPLAPGSYDVQFTGTHRNGATLELTSRIVVGPGGEYMLIGDNIPIIR